MVRDTLERATEPNLNLRAYLKDVYAHPVFKDEELDRPLVIDEEEESNAVVPTKRRNSNRDSEASSEAGASKT